MDRIKLFKNLVFYFLIPATLVYVAFRVNRSNSGYVYYIQTSPDDGAEEMAIEKLNELVERNFLDREYYEAVACSDIGARTYANYNKEHQVLLITANPQSGWQGAFYATPQELEMIADKKIPVFKLSEFLKPFRWEKVIKFPNRSGV